MILSSNRFIEHGTISFLRVVDYVLAVVETSHLDHNKNRLNVNMVNRIKHVMQKLHGYNLCNCNVKKSRVSISVIAGNSNSNISHLE